MRSFWQAWFDAGKFAFEAQIVIAMRVTRLFMGKKRSDAELRRMFSEKIAAFVEAQTAMMVALMGGAKPKTVMLKVQNPYRRRVSANRRRLVSSQD